MMKKVVKFTILIIMVLLITNIFAVYSHKSYAAPVEVTDDGGSTSTSTSTKGMTDVTQDLNFWGDIKENGVGTFFDKKVEKIASAVRYIGIIISVITLSVIGIKFMLGSVEERAQYKQTLMPWLIGAIMVFAMTNIPSIIYSFTKGTFN